MKARHCPSRHRSGETDTRWRLAIPVALALAFLPPILGTRLLLGVPDGQGVARPPS